jgi:hypothetical protein
MDAGGRAVVGREQRHRARERQVGIVGAQHGARRRGAARPQDRRRGACRGQRLLVFRIGDERQIAGPGVVDAGDAQDLEIAVALQTGAETGGEVA